jgi:hypothetical protein
MKSNPDTAPLFAAIYGGIDGKEESQLDATITVY